MVMRASNNVKFKHIFVIFSFADVREVARRECSPLICPSFTDLQGPWPDTYPVCANNGYTYGHIHQVRCLKDFIPGIYSIAHHILIEYYYGAGQTFDKFSCWRKRVRSSAPQRRTVQQQSEK